jgi:hypothetical protein
VDREEAANAFGIAPALVAEIMYLNDEIVNERKRVEVELCGPVRPYYPEFGQLTHSFQQDDPSAPFKRWQVMRDWVAKNIKTQEATK